ncbi:hypothetical protein SDC9_44888 [bioreactor metagenome]|uniref:Uncharacterized protein n=1 Tax=bioreactor metagenome TaxID=1076179 RepID=A0A644W4P8_9ZZZZ
MLNISLEAELLEAYIVTASIYIEHVFAILIGQGLEGIKIAVVVQVHLSGFSSGIHLLSFNNA